MEITIFSGSGGGNGDGAGQPLPEGTHEMRVERVTDHVSHRDTRCLMVRLRPLDSRFGHRTVVRYFPREGPGTIYLQQFLDCFRLFSATDDVGFDSGEILGRTIFATIEHEHRPDGIRERVTGIPSATDFGGPVP